MKVRILNFVVEAAGRVACAMAILLVGVPIWTIWALFAPSRMAIAFDETGRRMRAAYPEAFGADSAKPPRYLTSQTPSERTATPRAYVH